MIGPTDYVYSPTFSPDGNRLAVSSNDKTVRIYDVHGTPDPLPLSTLGAVGGSVFAVAYSPDGKHMIAGGRATSVTQWSVDPASYARTLCPLVGDPITRQEWSLYVPGSKYDPPCR